MFGRIERIEMNPMVCSGKPVIKGIRIPVSVILEQVAKVNLGTRSFPGIRKGRGKKKRPGFTMGHRERQQRVYRA
jgi:hypothetical protein